MWLKHGVFNLRSFYHYTARHLTIRSSESTMTSHQAHPSQPTRLSPANPVQHTLMSPTVSSAAFAGNKSQSSSATAPTQYVPPAREDSGAPKFNMSDTSHPGSLALSAEQRSVKSVCCRSSHRIVGLEKRCVLVISTSRFGVGSRLGDGRH